MREIRRCPLACPRVVDLRCADCGETLFEAAAHTEAEIAALTAAGRCGRWVLDRAGRALVAVVALTTAARAAELEVHVEDARGNPVPSAVVRVPAVSEGRVRVVPETGTWRGDAVPGAEADVALPEGPVRIEVAAPGFTSRSLDVTLKRKRVRRVTVVLEEPGHVCPEDEVEIVFGRDKPLD